jgi:uncharacterized protein
MHGIRLLNECREILLSGKITLPRPEKDLLIRVRTGKYSLDKVLNTASLLFSECAEAERTSALPERIDRQSASEVLTECYMKSWRSYQR